MENKTHTPAENRERFLKGEISLDEYMALPKEERMSPANGLDDNPDDDPPQGPM